MNIHIDEKEVQSILVGLMLLEEKIMASGKSMENEERVLHGPALKALILRFLKLEEEEPEIGWQVKPPLVKSSDDPQLANAMAEGLEHVRQFLEGAGSPGCKMAMVAFNPLCPGAEYLVVGSAGEEQLERAIEMLILGRPYPTHTKHIELETNP